MVTTELDISISRVAKIASRPVEKKLRLRALTALVIGSMVGSGVFSLPQNMAAGAGHSR
jgi:arginine:ornithine antiporter/lysine permease